MSAAGGMPPLPPGWVAARSGDWLDRLWEFPDLAPAPAVRRERSGGAACVGVDPRVFYPEPWEMTAGAAVPSEAERKALGFCSQCPVRDWCLERDLADSSTPSKVLGVRGGMRQADRRVLHVKVFGKRARNGAQQ
ncbi:WhiB family transcriptional regulator (plasmid) [Streptomyces sp. NBC_01232]|uniref:WhiB family transcriptional regulator n=1 Tax=Streptomyces sp. NBC_01232 TaxID=2903786 RepID=UPI002E13AD2D|nr:WhiB family transcriptional regulator [Streptomyces sp. NBC_01232]